MPNDEFIEELLRSEGDSVTSVMGFMSYNPSIGRVLERGGVKKFQNMVLEMVLEFPRIDSTRIFDETHYSYIQKVISEYRTNNGSLVSFGQAQKPINVFNKVYVDWAKKPDEGTRTRILPFLHVPLDRINMKTIKKKYPEWYKDNIKPLIKDSENEFSLSKIDQELYYRWQTFFREKYPAKPLIFDVAWALNR